ncbi:MAG: Asp-tRNA(Asn)/Glu-tRNA(Gln) amidotransferase subunit GatC [Candidatus Aenigmarchaeota archaeon]|nr:Asp-tRNA(Asn)/Glu-tRNA(Gln) amidotransferase subunit GatC [Candidatus Aenigmarchaeota archaeon]
MKKEKISEDTVMHVAKLARINLTPKEAKKYQKDMNEILAAFKVLKDVKANRPSFHPMDVKDVLRKDELEKCLPREEALKNTKHKERGYFKGPKAV